MLINESEIINLEKKIHLKSFRNNPDNTQKIVDDSFFEFTRSGKIVNKQDFITYYQNDPTPDMIMKDPKVTPLSSETALLTYTLSMIMDDGKPELTRRSTIWKRTNGQWKIIFHQGTIVLI